MKLSNYIKTNILLISLVLGIPSFAADLNQSFDSFLYGNNNVYKIKPKEISILKKSKNNKPAKKSIEVERFQQNINEEALTDEEYITSLKRADNKKIRKQQFKLNVINDNTENEDVETTETTSSLQEDYDAQIRDPSDKKFFSRNKKEKLKNDKKDKKDKKQKQAVEPSNLTLSADETFYNPDKNEIEAVGNAKFEISGQDFVLYGDRIIFSHETNSVKAYKNVKIIKDENVTTGDFINIDMSTACGWIQNPVTYNYSVSIKAKDAYVYSEKVEENEGVAKVLEDKRIIADSSGMASTLYSVNSVNISDFYTEKPEPSPMKFKVKEIIVKPKEKNNDIILKGVSVYYKKLKLATVPIVEIATDNNNTAMQTNIPEIGGDTILGMYVGPAWAFDLPYSSTLKIAPLVMYNADNKRFGVGGAATFMNKYNTTQFAYGSPKNKFIFNGIQKITDKLNFQYSQESYSDEWFMGARRPQYAFSFHYADSYFLKDIQAHFRHTFNLGVYTDDGNSSFRKNAQGRARWLGEFRKDLLSYTNNENTFTGTVGIVAQAGISQYSKGDTFGIFRIGPNLRTTYRFWTQDLTYFQSKAEGHTPFKFDDYYYGESNLTLVETLRLHKYLSIGYIGSLALAGRNSHYKDCVNKDINKLLQENRFIVSFGPDEGKITVGYDFYRQITSVYYTMLLGTKDMEIEFNKAVLNNPDKIGAEEEEENKFVTKMRKLKYKVFPATNPDFNRETDLYPNQVPANGAEDIDSEMDTQEQKQLEEQLKNNLSPIFGDQRLMKNDRM